MERLESPAATTVREWLARTLLVAVPLALAFVSVEGLLRLGVIKNKFHDEAVVEGALDGPRILILGDSFMGRRGHHVYERLVKALEPYRVSLLNTASGGMGPADYLAQMRARGMKFRPDLVLLSYYAGNDLTNEQYRRVTKNPLKRLLKPLFLEFYTYHFYHEVLERLHPRTVDYQRMEKEGVPRPLVDLAKAQALNPSLLELSLERKNYLLDNLLMETEENQRAWEKVKGILSEIHRVSQNAGAKLLIVVFPHTIQVNRSHFDFYQKLSFNLDERTLTSDRPQALLREFCEAEGIACLDLLPYFRARRGRELYQENDDHVNREGSRLSAALLFRFLQKNGQKNGDGSISLSV